ncbi:uncharacterized protein LOC118421183 [Branchiostoma floridae]|uniref:Uncharacterized protein LOC118421183 n=1 Tax=Branchiostoma floridae TaxID=7739 RepID=A0A9J7LK18_BRAFL|nr:uncharacterized protein LOC118421183 [Branchiostoma floridae]
MPTEFEKDCLAAHNDYRAKHGVSPLKLSKSLTKHAQKWAEHLVKCSSFQHSGNHDYGENIGMKWSSNNEAVSGASIAEMWYSEIEKYDFRKGGHQPGTGHFTQVVWKGSQEFGVGVATDGRGKTIVVGNYYPPGNMLGDFDDNVLPPGSPPKGGRGPSPSNRWDDKPPKGNFRPIPTSRPSRRSPSPEHTCSKVDTGDFAEDCLSAQNDYRQKHGAPPLKISAKLCKHAQQWADRLVKSNTLQHSGNHDYGENIGMKWSSDNKPVSGASIADMWYSEIEKYDFRKGGHQPGTGHFTQVVWKGSQEFGVGVATDGRGKTIVVGNYYPPGNMLGDFDENVLPPGSPVKGGHSKPRDPSPSNRWDSKPSRPSRRSPSPEQSRVDTGDFAEDCLSAQNDYRQKHGAPPLKMSAKLCKHAQQWADHLVKSNTLQHSGNHDYGENIGMKWSSDNKPVSGASIADMWYSEIEKYDFRKGGHQPGTGHFTQVVWKESQEFGVGVATDGRGKTIVVGNYYPPGNMLGDFDDNVLPPGSPVKGGHSKPRDPSPSNRWDDKPSGGNFRPTPTSRPSRRSPSPEQSKGDFAEDCLSAQNDYRQKHGAPPLKMSAKLCKHAQQWADRLVKSNTLQHSGNHDYGENIGMKWSSDNKPVSGARNFYWRRLRGGGIF